MNFETEEENFYHQKKLTTGTYHHVGVSDSFHFVHIVTLNDGIKQGVQVVQEVNHLLAKEKQNKKRSWIPNSFSCAQMRFGMYTWNGVLSADIFVNPTISLK